MEGVLQTLNLQLVSELSPLGAFLSLLCIRGLCFHSSTFAWETLSGNSSLSHTAGPVPLLGTGPSLVILCPPHSQPWVLCSWRKVYEAPSSSREVLCTSLPGCPLLQGRASCFPRSPLVQLLIPVSCLEVTLCAGHCQPLREGVEEQSLMS